MRIQTLLKPMAVAVSALLLSACGNDASSPKPVKLAYVEWDSCVAATNVAKAALEQADIAVETVSVSGAMLYQGLATGDVDAVLCAWLPTTHGDYYEKTSQRLENVGINMKKAQLGLAVPSYMEIDSIADLADAEVSKSLNDRIIGIDPGAGLMNLTQQVIAEYELPEKLIEGSDATMTAVLADEIRQQKPVVVTSWTPHWMWASFELKYLDDPKGVYGEPDNVHTLVRTGFAEANPEAYKILKAFYLSSDDRGAVMAANRDSGNQPEVDAQQWVEQNQEQVQAWLQ